MTKRSQASKSSRMPDMTDWETFIQNRPVHWHSGNRWPSPKKLVVLDSTPSAQQALQVLHQGVALVWTGDFHQGCQLLQSLKRRLTTQLAQIADKPMPQGFHQLRLLRAQQARLLGSLVVIVNEGWQLSNRRAPEIAQACETALDDESSLPFLMPLTELLGILSAHQWQLNGIEIPELGERIYPRYGVFAPTRREYLQLIQSAPLPHPCSKALDLGTGTGVIAAILARRGINHITAIDSHQPALHCARENIDRLGLNGQVIVQKGDLLEGTSTYDLIVCNPPWLPGVARNSLEAAVHDPDHRMLRGFLSQAPRHLESTGQAWLIMSNLAHLLGLRSEATLLQWINDAGLRVLERHDTRPSHPKVTRQNDPLANWRSKEVTSLWRLSLA